uniref:50S ribosomal protein L20 n=1 Tax=Glaukea argentea TaxID=2894057 RepID=A0A386B1J8_9CHLO|nr:ribosomal protein L20 [Udotea argentea]AYC65584.1 ribosomal protein L20 [Udotea argentea]
MTRVKRGKNIHKRHQKKFKITKGFRSVSSLLFKNINQQFLTAFKNAFIDRHLRKRFFRSIWISRINAKVRQFGLNYHLFIYKNTKINRKIIAQLALYDRFVFNNLLKCNKNLIIKIFYYYESILQFQEKLFQSV